MKQFILIKIVESMKNGFCAEIDKEPAIFVIPKIDWIPCDKNMPDTKLVDETSFNYEYRSQPVFVQTSENEVFSAQLKKNVYKDKSCKDRTEWLAYIIDGKKIMITNKVIAWFPVPELYKKEDKNETN